MTDFKSIGFGGQKPRAIPLKDFSAVTSHNGTFDDSNDKNDRLASIVASQCTDAIFIDNRVLGKKATTSSIAQASIIIAKTCEKTEPEEWEKLNEVIGHSVFTITSPEKNYGDFESVFMQIEKRELRFLLPLKHELENRRIIFVGWGNRLMANEIAEKIKNCHCPFRFADIFSEVKSVDWCEFFLIVEVSEDEIEGSFPGLTLTRHWHRFKNKLEFLSKKQEIQT
jgi:hypothetical protein